MSFFEELWLRIRFSDAFRTLPEELRDPPGLYVLAAAVVGLAAFLAWLVLRALVRRLSTRGAGKRVLKREIRELARVGDYRSVGERYESLGEERAALAAYRRGGHDEEITDLHRRRGEIAKAKAAAREGELWVIYADLCRDDDDHAEAAVAYERAGKLYDAAKCYQSAGETLEAARCYVAAGMEWNGVRLLMKGEGRAVALALEKALRATFHSARGAAMSPDMAAAVRRGAQLWLAEKQARRAYDLAVDAERFEVAAPIARDYLEPEPPMIDVCLRAGDFLGAAKIAEGLGDAGQAALYRGEHHERRDESEAAARAFETAEAWARAAEQWAAHGDITHAAELFARAEDYAMAARLYGELGDEARREAMEAELRRRDPLSVFGTADVAAGENAGEIAGEDDATRRVRPHPPAVDQPAPTAATQSERYVLQDEIGRGGMGVVHRAYDTVLERPVAYKMLSPDLTGAVAKPQTLLTEARAAARLAHPNIVQVYDAGLLAAGGCFVVMELIEGKNFSDLLKKRRPSIDGAIEVARQVISALVHAHERRIVHRDLKPSNLMWTPDKQVKLTDFGLARAFEASVGRIVTQAAGTPYYMAPEQIRGAAVDPRTDIYSFGCVLFEMLCQRTPFTGGGTSIYHHLNTSPEDPRTLRPEVPGALAEIVLHCLAKEPEERPASAAEIGRRLGDLDL